LAKSSAHTAPRETPLMAQYRQIKAKYPDAILLFRMGDFYETFGQDAIITSKVLGIVLTKRSNGAAADIELAGFPHHALDTYLPRLVRAGHRVAICEQLEDPKLAKKVVKRGVTELITPGIALSDRILDHRQNNFLAALAFGDPMGIALLDLSTGEFLAAQGSPEYIDKLLQGFRPAEVIFAKSRQKDFRNLFGSRFYTYGLDDWIFDPVYAAEKLQAHFGVRTLKGFGLDGQYLAVTAAGAVLHYLGETEHHRHAHISTLSRLTPGEHVWLDRFTIRNLELLQPAAPDGMPLVQVLDHTLSPMGSRLMKQWVVLPLTDPAAIAQRHDIVEHLVKDPALQDTLATAIRETGDLERAISRVSMRRVNPREVKQIGRALEALVPLKKACAGSGQEELKALAARIDPCEALAQRIRTELVDDPPAQLSKGSVISPGVSAELDELRDIIHHGKDKLAALQQEEALKTGITSLKVGFNNVFGYYLEVTHAHRSKVPDHWIRKQTLVNAERYITPELKEYENQITGAEEKIQRLEQELYEKLVEGVAEFIRPIQENARAVAELDCLLAFARNATRFHYKRPVVDDSFEIEIREGRHPVIEQCMPPGERYVPNDIFLSSDDQQILVITGPNMSGKSAVLRQTALIVLMAQIGSFVPAEKARIGLVDKIFTRVGASDNITSGESTFMVEMNETASIMNNLSPRSLILLDEIGRGTSTFDGISIAWSLAEFLHNHPKARPRTLFATHYHELNELAERYPRIRNFNVSVKEVGQKVLFLRKLVPGGSQHSFGIHVARMAGMPAAIVQRATEILAELEKHSLTGELGAKGKKIRENLQQLPAAGQLAMFPESAPDPIAEELKALVEQIDINTLTPLEALMKLNELTELIRKGNEGGK